MNNQMYFFPNKCRYTKPTSLKEIWCEYRCDRMIEETTIRLDIALVNLCTVDTVAFIQQKEL
jgi:hypothetical protein